MHRITYMYRYNKTYIKVLEKIAKSYINNGQN